ncbi:MAG: DNA polymerase III subunit delta [Bacteroidales bacterium]|nr:DNA polymerase III subunit delta [Bacteroidales bacterium]MBN2697345.1 DNA polymerase III subunit delta [Bacteroidales bacterium]
MTYENIIGELQKKIYHPVYFLYGEEPYYIDLITGFISKNVLTDAEKSFNQMIVYGKDSDGREVMNLAKRFPMMASLQVVIVKEAQDLNGFDDLVHYVEKPLKSTLLVLNYKYRNPDNRKKVFKALSQHAICFESKKLRDYQIPGWITGYLSGRKYSIQPKAASLLSEFLGTDLSKITNEIEKLIITLSDKETTITPEHIEKNIGISKDYNQFELQNALGNKDVLKANRIINYFAQNEKNNHITLTISSLYYYFLKLLKYYYVKDRSQKNLAALFNVNPYFVSGLVEAAKRYKPVKLVEIISILREYDMRSKGFNGDTTSSGSLLKEMIFKILH